MCLTVRALSSEGTTTSLCGGMTGLYAVRRDETGAEGEQEFNMELANHVEGRLTQRGWVVLRPELTARGLEWEDYLRWVARQSRRGVPVLELHGQGALPGMAHAMQVCGALQIQYSTGTGVLVYAQKPKAFNSLTEAVSAGSLRQRQCAAEPGPRPAIWPVPDGLDKLRCAAPGWRYPGGL